jgi:membrane-associated phospholipid phosphatase
LIINVFLVVCYISTSIYILYLAIFLLNKTLLQNKHILINSIILFFTFFATISYFFIDAPLANYFHDNLANYLYKLFAIITEVGHFFGALVLGFVYLVYEKFYKKDNLFNIKAKAIALLKAFIISGIFVNVLKAIYGRARPIEFFNNNNYDFYPFQAFHLLKSFFITSTTDISTTVAHSGYSFSSFPSGHSITAFVIFSFLALAYSKHKILFIMFLFLGAIIAFSRVVLYQHFLSDVLMGGLLGFGFAYYFYNTLKLKSNKFS